MNNIPFDFDVSGIDPFVAGGAPLPSGFYVLMATEMEVKENGGKNGHNLAIVNTVQHGEFKGRKIFDNLNLWIQGNSAAEEIAYKQLSSYGHAVGVTSGKDLTELANKAYIAEVELVAATEDKQNPNTGETIKGRKESNRVLRRLPATEENFAQYIAAAPSTPQTQAAANAPVMNAPASAPTTAPASAPTFVPPAQAQAPAPTPSAPPAATGTPGASTPPWLQKK